MRVQPLAIEMRDSSGVMRSSTSCGWFCRSEAATPRDAITTSTGMSISAASESRRMHDGRPRPRCFRAGIRRDCR